MNSSVADDLYDEVDNYQRAALFFQDAGHTHICGGCSARYNENPEMIGKVRVLIMKLCDKCEAGDDKTKTFTPPLNMKYSKRLTTDEVKEIRRLFAQKKHRRYLAMKFNVGLTTIDNVVNYRIYKDIVG